MTGRDNIRLLLLLVGFNIAPHFANATWWVSILAATFWLVRWAQLYSYLPESTVWFRRMAVVTLTASVYFKHQTLLGVEASADLLILMVVVKTFEIRKYKDVMILAYLCFYLLMTKALDSQSVLVTVFLIVDVFVIVGAMAYFHSGEASRKWMQIFRQSVSLSILGLPFAIVLFLVFPRFATGWGKGGEQQLGSTGFSDQLRPGDLAQLRRSGQVVFRSTLPGAKLAVSDLYWRGAVLDLAGGMNWSRRPGDLEMQNEDELLNRGEMIEQQIIMEPSYERWLFALDVPSRLRISGARGNGARRDSRGFFVADRYLSNKVHYQVWSHPDGTRDSKEKLGAYLELELEPETVKKTRRWVDSIRLERESTHAWVNYFLRFFQKEGFVYSLEPGFVAGLDEFLFEGKSGFCEHYATALGTLLRMVKIPSRVVVGFHGGTPSLVGDYVLVRALDAHAWVEYWDTDRWIRIDPVAFVAPARIELGSVGYEEYLEQSRILKNGGDSSLLLSGVGRYLKNLYFNSVLLWDQLDAMWVQFLFRFDYEYQKELLQHLAGTELSRGQLYLLLVLLLALLLLRTYLRLSKKQRVALSLRLYRLLCWRLKSLGWERKAQEGPLHFQARIVKAVPAWQMKLQEVFQPLVQDRYGNSPLSLLKSYGLVFKILLLRRP